MDEFYTRFRYECWSITEDRSIGLAHFEAIRVHYPTTAVVKVFRNKLTGHKEFSLTHLCQPLHRNIVRLYAYYETAQYAVLFLEHCEKGALSDYLPTLVKSSEKVLVEMMEDIAQAVAALHSHSIIHRDLKPHNIFLTSHLICKLGDFETAKELCDSASLNTLPRGTVAYMSPQKANSLMYREALEPNQGYLEDIWALGKTFLEMGTGKVDMEVASRAARGQEALHPYISETIRKAGKSAILGELIENMLISRNITATDVCTALSRLKTGAIRAIPLPQQTISPKCVLCTEQLSLIELPCKHNYCISHFSQHLSALLSCPSTTILSHIKCLRCVSPIPFDKIDLATSYLPPELLNKLRRIDSLSASSQCGCGESYPLVKWESGRAITYVWKCRTCKQSVCSWCNSKGGHFLSSKSKCPYFPY